MINVELIAKLKQLPADATILIWSDARDITTDQVTVEHNSEANEILITETEV